jgi:hypothetical protein
VVHTLGDSDSGAFAVCNVALAEPGPGVRGLHSFTFQLNVSASYGTGGTLRGCLGVV